MSPHLSDPYVGSLSQQSASDVHRNVVMYGYAQQVSTMLVGLRRSEAPVQHWDRLSAADCTSRQQSADVDDPSSGTLHESPNSQQSAAETQVSPGTGQHVNAPTIAFPPHTVPVH